MMHGLVRFGWSVLVCAVLAACGTTADPGGGPDDAPGGDDPGGGGDAGWPVQMGTLANDAAFDVAVDAEGRIVTVGSTNGPLHDSPLAGSTDVFVTVHGPDGGRVWTRQFGTERIDEARGVAVADDAIYVSGFTDGTLGATSFGGRDAFLVKLSRDGERVWTRQLGTAWQDRGQAVAASPDGGVFVAGWAGRYAPTPADGGGFLARFDADGERLWTRRIVTSGIDTINVLAADASGHAYVAGETTGALEGHTNHGQVDLIVLRVDPTGEIVWTRQFGSAGRDAGDAIAVADDDVYLAGLAAGPLDGSGTARAADVVVMQLDAATGASRWVRTFASLDPVRAHDVVADADGAYVAGDTQGESEGHDGTGAPVVRHDLFLARWDADGSEAWTRVLGTPADDSASAVAVGPDGAVYVAGATRASFEGARHAGFADALLFTIEP